MARERSPAVPPRGFQCKRCGHCCLAFGGQHAAAPEDVARWVDAGREDILEWVVPIHADGQVVAWDLCVSPRTGDEASRCPWLRKMSGRTAYSCTIYDVRPNVCRGYPGTLRHAVITECGAYADHPSAKALRAAAERKERETLRRRCAKNPGGLPF